MFEQLEAKVKA